MPKFKPDGQILRSMDSNGDTKKQIFSGMGKTERDRNNDYTFRNQQASSGTFDKSKRSSKEDKFIGMSLTNSTEDQFK